ncbi:outer membrane protein assembly factor BamB family protein (plasmid) [Coraliomargarita sp. W4R53]
MHGFVTDTAGIPLANIAVSNGRDVVTTDHAGRFELEIVTPFATLTRPEGYTTDTWWLPASDDVELNFELREHPQSLPFEFAHLTDTHMTVPPAPGEEPDDAFGLYVQGSLPHEIRAFLQSLPERAPQAQAVFITGDLVDHGLPEEYEEYVAAIATSPLPVHVIPGNHDHMNGGHGAVVSRNNYLTNKGTPERYEHYIGPRWYSFDIPGCHIVTLDWHTHELGLDHELQNEWVKADLAQIEPGSPWILLFHDQPGASILDEVPWQPVAAFSGHWHTSRVVRVGDTLHVNSPTTFFASLDYTPPAFRRVIWDGVSITMHTETVRVVADPPALGDVSRSTFAPTPATDDASSVLWRTGLSGAGQRQRLTVVGDLVLAGTQIEDEPRGHVEALDLVTGGVVWNATVDSAVKTAPAVGGNVVVAAEVSGDVHGLDLATGERLWTVASSDPLRRFAWNAPTIFNGVVYLGDQSDLRAINVTTGDVLWRRTDLSPHHNLVNHAAPLIVGDLLIMGFWPSPQHPIGLNRHTGESVWQSQVEASDPFTSFKKLKALLIMGTATSDEARDVVLMPAFGNTTCVDRATGAIRWSAEHPGSFSPASPVVTARGYVATAAGHGLLMLDPVSGETIWELEIDGDAPFPMRSYSKRPHPVIAPPTLVGEHLVLPGLDGVVRVVDLDGHIIAMAQIASPLAGAFELSGDRLVAVGTNGNVVCLSASALVSGELTNASAAVTA